MSGASGLRQKSDSATDPRRKSSSVSDQQTFRKHMRGMSLFPPIFPALKGKHLRASVHFLDGPLKHGERALNHGVGGSEGDAEEAGSLEQTARHDQDAVAG